VPAACVDFTDDSLSGCQRPGDRRVGGRTGFRDIFDYANELMAQRSLKAGVAARYFQVGIANARKRDPHQSLAASGGSRHVFNRNVLISTAESFHTVRTSPACWKN